jgi:hypothetical protein
MMCGKLPLQPIVYVPRKKILLTFLSFVTGWLKLGDAYLGFGTRIHLL